MRKNIYCTLDTETFGGAANPKGIYHLAGIIHDRKGKILAVFNYLISEHYEEINKDEYAKKNFHKYLEMINDGIITMIATEKEAVKAVNELCNFYNVKYMMAYNSSFDFCKTMCKEFIIEREFIDIYLMALQTITHIKRYAKFCRTYNLIAKSGKSVSTSAESVYAYITNNAEYSEEHTAMEDSKIEMEIFLACLKCHKKFTKNSHAWACKEGKVFPVKEGNTLNTLTEEEKKKYEYLQDRVDAIQSGRASNKWYYYDCILDTIKNYPKLKKYFKYDETQTYWKDRVSLKPIY